MYDQITAAQIIKRQRAEQGPPPPPRWGFGAIAYSPSTGAYGWTTDQRERGSAESFATNRCYRAAWRGRTRQDGPVTDVAVVASGRIIMLALAVNGRGGYGVGAGPTARKAERAARRNCPGKGTVVLSVWSAAPEPAHIDHRFYGMGGTTGELPLPPDTRYEVGTWTRCGVCGRPQCPEHSATTNG
jgi:serine/threonine-protein kinase